MPPECPRRTQAESIPSEEAFFEMNLSNIHQKHPELFHYTSIPALKGILETNSLWATRATHLNDSSELELIWPSITRQFIKHYNKGSRIFLQRNPEVERDVDGSGGVSKIAKADGSRIVNEMHLQLVGDEDYPSHSPIFVVSFATHGGKSQRNKYHRRHGMLSQWRGYGGDEGVAIVFDTAQIEKLLQSEDRLFLYWPLRISKVIYFEKDISLRKHFSSLFETLETCARNFIEPKDKEPLESLVTRAFSELSWEFGRLKHVGFHEERECRIIVGATRESLREKLAALGEKNLKPVKETHLRHGHLTSIPYIRLFEDLGKNLPIKRIIIGPSKNQKDNLEKVHELAGSRGIKVQKSGTPYVGSA